MKKPDNLLPETGRGSSQVSYMGQSIDDMIHEMMVNENIPGISLAIVQAPYIPRTVSYGISDIDTKKLASPHTIWAIGPISQGYAIIAIMQLYERGKLNLKDKVSKYLQGLPENWKEITIMQLLQHATGIADYRQQNGYKAEKEYSAAELISLVKNIPLAFTPGTDVSQSATNFLLVAEVVEKASQMTYHDFVTKNQFEFLGLKHTCFAEDFSKLKQENLSGPNIKHSAFLHSKDYINPTENAVGYNQELNRRPLPSSSALKGFGDIWASAADISFWDIALAGSVLVEKPENRALIYKPTPLDNGKIIPAMAGWQFYHHKGLMDIKERSKGFHHF